MRRKPDRPKGEAPTAATVEASVSNPTQSREGTDAMDDNPPCQGFQSHVLFPFGQAAAQRLQGLKSGHISAILTTQAGQALTGWMVSFSEVLEAADRLIAELGRDAVQLQVEEVLR